MTNNNLTNDTLYLDITWYKGIIISLGYIAFWAYMMTGWSEQWQLMCMFYLEVSVLSLIFPGKIKYLYTWYAEWVTMLKDMIMAHTRFVFVGDNVDETDVIARAIGGILGATLIGTVFLLFQGVLISLAYVFYMVLRGIFL